jgi:formate/nitrite transporter FocA (FNT family)
MPKRRNPLTPVRSHALPQTGVTMSEDEKSKEHDQEEQKEAEIQERQSPSSKIVHAAVLKEGEEELERSTSALAWSGLAAGLSMGLSLIAEGALHAVLPHTPAFHLVSSFGYSLGFLAVILGRQQLFTENTLTPILVLMDRRDAKTFMNVSRLWLTVLLSNLVGCVIVAYVLANTNAVEPAIRESFFTLAREAMQPSFTLILWRGVFAGWIIALLVWLLPFAESGRFWVIVTFTYFIGAAHFSHVIVGSVEAYVLAAHGEVTWLYALQHYTLASLIGNILGGVSIVAAINHAQVVAGKE